MLHRAELFAGHPVEYRVVIADAGEPVRAVDECQCCRMTAEQMETLAAQGRYWFMRADGSFYATTDYTEPDSGVVYPARRFPGLGAQWDGDWSAAVVALEPLFAKLAAYREES